MDENPITISIYDLDISGKGKNCLARAGILTLSELVDANLDDLFAKRGVGNETLRELLVIIAHKEEIIAYFKDRAKRIQDLLPAVQDVSIDELKFGTRTYNALKRSGIYTVGALIQLNQKEISELRNVGDLSRKEITDAIQKLLQNDATEIKREYATVDDVEENSTAIRKAEVIKEIEGITIDKIPLSTRALRALTYSNIHTVAELLELSAEDIIKLHSVGRQTTLEIISAIEAITQEGKEFFDKLSDGTATYLDGNKEVPLAEKGYDYAVIDILK